jgi:hypothetical protein
VQVLEIPIDLAEAVRFELTEGSHLRRFSRPVPSTTRPRFLGYCEATLYSIGQEDLLQII